MDNYIVKICQNGKGGCYFYKNNVLHREAGPAVLKNITKNEFEQLADKDLYQEEIIPELFPSDYQISFLEEPPPANDKSGFAGSIIDAIYYLDGVPILEEEFKINRSRIKLKDELSTELSLSQSSNKKSKV